ncbi:amino acid permease [Pseudenhygromyxa sp. WMMC2535]|nr:amino acid permease [Pseudenhygromyxa sp. WMMC2535]
MSSSEPDKGSHGHGHDQDQPVDGDGEKMGLNASWSMAVGGMVGGGIFSVLGVVIAIAGQWAWLSFLLAGLIALATGDSYARLTVAHGSGGGAFEFLRSEGREAFAGSLSWILIIGYVLTISVYAFTFGHYLAHVLGGGGLTARVAGVAIIVTLAAVNLRGVRNSAKLEIFMVWGKVAVLVALAVFGLSLWEPSNLAEGVEPRPLIAAAIGAGAVFMAYEGFQLLTYDYGDMKQPDRTLPRAVVLAIVSVTAIYVVVTLGTAVLVGAGTLVVERETALAVAGKVALGTAGLWIVTIAAVLSTGSAINATLFATARLVETVARDKELPEAAAKRNAAGVPARAIVGLATAAAVLASLGALSKLVEAASMTFLFTFAVVNGLAARESEARAWVSWIGLIGASLAALILAARMAIASPSTLAFLGVLAAIAVFARPALLRRLGDRPPDNDNDNNDNDAGSKSGEPT